MNSTLITALMVAMVISQALVVKATLLSSKKTESGLAADVKSYIDSQLASGGKDSAALFKKIADLEAQASRLEYLRGTLAALEEGQARLGQAAISSPTTINDLLAPARERELQRFRQGLEELCAGSAAGGPSGATARKLNPSGSSSSSNSLKARAPFVQSSPKSGSGN